VKRVALALTAVLVLTGCTVQAPPPPTANDATELAQYRLDALWGATGLPNSERPVPKRAPTTVDSEGFVRCMQIRDYPGFTTDANGYSFVPLTSGMSDDEKLDWYFCYAATIGIATDDIFPTSIAQLGYAYDYYKRQLIPCLAAHGYVVPDIPSRRTYIAGMAGTDKFTLWGAPLWSPSMYVQQPTGLWSVERTLSECPANPPGADFTMSVQDTNAG
jgi:hypothetical protein